MVRIFKVAGKVVEWVCKDAFNCCALAQWIERKLTR